MIVSAAQTIFIPEIIGNVGKFISPIEFAQFTLMNKQMNSLRKCTTMWNERHLSFFINRAKDNQTLSAIFKALHITLDRNWSHPIQLICANTPSAFIKEKIKQVIQYFPYMNILDISSCFKNSATDIGGVPLLANLQRLKVNYNIWTSEHFIEVLLKCPQLKNLNMSDCNGIQDIDFPEHLLLDHLEELNVDNSTFSFQAICNILHICPNIKKLYAHGYRERQENRLSFSQLDMLEEIHFCNSNITGEILEDILKKCPQVKKINLIGCRDISNFTVSEIPKLLYVKEINLSETYQSLAHLQKLLSICPNVEILDMNGCGTVDNFSFQPVPTIEKVRKIYFESTKIPANSFRTLQRLCPSAIIALRILDFKKC